MSSKRRIIAVALAGVMLLSSVTAAGAVSSATANETADTLSVTVQEAGNDGATVTVTQNDSAVANASVTVGVTDENATYEGAGNNYTTGENGTVALPEPDENVTVEVTAEKGNATGTATATLTVAAEDENQSFGDLVSSFVHEMMNAGDDGGPIGQVISDFVTSNNPGNADEKRPDNAGKPDDAGNSGDNGKPADAGTQNNTNAQNGTDDGSQGPPENAGNDDGDTEDDSEKGNNGNGNDKSKGK